MTTKSFTSLRDAAKEIARDARGRERRVTRVVRQAARKTAKWVAANVPVAFGELADGVHVDDIGRGWSNVVVSAPHAAAVEVGSRPHKPPLDPLIRWVELRGLQGLTQFGHLHRRRRQDVMTASEQSRFDAAQAIGKALRDRLGMSGAASWKQRTLHAPSGGAAGADPATVAIARAIQQKIAKRGTRPRRYMMAAIEPARRYLDRFVKEALPDR